MKTLNGHQIRQYREAAGLSRPALIRLLDRMDDPDGPRFTGWTVSRITDLEKSGNELGERASAEFFRAFSMAPDAGSEYTPRQAGQPVVCDNSRTWVAVRQTPAFAVALDIARQERNSQIKLDQARAAFNAILGANDEAAHDAFIAARQFYRNDNNVLWGAARMLAAMVDNDDELGALQVLRDELDRQDAGTPASR